MDEDIDKRISAYFEGLSAEQRSSYLMGYGVGYRHSTKMDFANLADAQEKIDTMKERIKMLKEKGR